MGCAGMIGEAVGRTRFKSDGLAMMSILMVRIYCTDLNGRPRIYDYVCPWSSLAGTRLSNRPAFTNILIGVTNLNGRLSLPLFLYPSRQERLGKGGGLDGHDQFIFEHVAPACGNLCRALGADFAMFLPVVLPPLLAALEAEVKFNMEAADPDEDGQVRLALAKATMIICFIFPLNILHVYRRRSPRSNVHG